eukprot:TRINITY_DN5569_c0_g1_i1.p1 TRINITY_DN5569_c0_g1~~TRINITY_DN5569_c0_g1_i1.p1  ORF type:complete len:322 (+),score=73.79 TRINITY_DN5569_c0_g1_i1:179-1144(+)
MDKSICKPGWEGEDCKIRWIADSNWSFYFNFYQAFVVISMAIATWMCLKELILAYKNRKEVNSRMWSVSTFCITLDGLGCLIRFVSFSVDPHSLRGILPPDIFLLSYVIPFVLWNNASYGVCLYWMELCIFVDVDKNPSFVKRLRPLLIGIIVLTWVVFTYLIFWPSSNLVGLYRVIVPLLIFMGSVSITIIYGLNIRNQLKDVTSKVAIDLKNRISLYSLWMCLICVFWAITVTTIPFVGKYWYLALQSLLRSYEEMLTAIQLILFHKREKIVNDEDEYSSLTIRGTTLNEDDERELSEEDDVIRSYSSEEEDEETKKDK